MGRAMLIIAAGASMIFGMVQLGLFGQKKSITENTAEYAKIVTAKNAAFTVIQMAMEEINEDSTWHPTQSSPWEVEVNDVDVTFYYDEIGSGSYYGQPDTIRVYSSAVYDAETATIVSLYEKYALDYVPTFKSALSFASTNFTFSMGGSSSISGNDRTGACADKPAVAVMNAQSVTKVADAFEVTTGDVISDSTAVALDSDLSYSPVDELIARLEAMPGATQVYGSYKEDLGTVDNPGVFFVNNSAKLTGGISEGYGIMVIRESAELTWDSAGVELSIAGNFTFNGLMIFENAYTMSGHGTPTINGSVLVGNTEGSTSTLDVNITGNLSIQYDCVAENYARRAAAGLLKQNRYTRLSTFE